eukprot:TRINITY_DN16979_c0_g1_i1.p1 TRINITY_DN16979_c0_g1~~TRINITY_DN16979_c0_g1_i1.p1  ORF type:complete len:213 (-),score=35.34 TRINITY_DN16979_c0_g1_i1:12-650(-)
MITRIREDRHLKEFNSSFLLCDHILHCEKAETSPEKCTSLSPKFMNRLNEICNPSQVRATETSLSVKKGFVLIQGPPGTGKTHTIVQLLNALHMRGYQDYFEGLSSYARQEREFQGGDSGIQSKNSTDENFFDLDSIVGDSSGKNVPLVCTKPRILVCAQSNAAIDEIMSRVMQNQFRDNSLKSYVPDIIRVGASSSELVCNNNTTASRTLR